MLIEPIGGELAQSQARRQQPLPGPLGADPAQHVSAHAQPQAQPPGQTHQQEIDQYRSAQLSDNFGRVLRRQHSYPTGERGHVDEEQRLVAQHHQPFGDRLGGRPQ
ncbi:hypothetical protein D3C76_1135860 [compost metagenome]